jgi:hypothetical protein
VLVRVDRVAVVLPAPAVRTSSSLLDSSSLVSRDRLLEDSECSEEARDDSDWARRSLSEKWFRRGDCRALYRFVDEVVRAIGGPPNGEPSRGVCSTSAMAGGARVRWLNASVAVTVSARWW